jgi:mono/diheme cytochrome c family protein
MKKVMVAVLCILSLLAIISMVYAQNPGMMGGQGTMGHGMMGSSQSETTQNPTQLSDGAKLFNANCRVCHVNGGNVINPNMPLKGSLKLKDYDSFLSFIRNPKMPDGSQGAMPSFTEGQISNEQAKTLYRYITSDEGELESGTPESVYCPRYGQCSRSGRGYHMGPGMMGGRQQGWNYCPYCGQPLGQGGYGMGPGKMGPGYYQQNEACQKFLDETAGTRKDLHNKRFEYFETIRNPKTTSETAAKLEKEFRDLHEKIYANAPQGCSIQQ